MSRIRVMVADDHPMVRAGVRATLSQHPDLLWVAEAADGAAALEQLARMEQLPDILILDIQMPRVGGLEVLAQLSESYPALPVVMITGSAEPSMLARCLLAGARGYVLKDQVSELLPLSIRLVHTGGCVIPSTMRLEAPPPTASSVPSNLSQRELTVLEFVAEGLSNREIGLHLSLSEATIKKRIQAILAKIAAEGRGHAAVIALRNGWIE